MDEFADLCTSLGRPFYAIAKSDSDDPREMFIAQLGPCGCEPKVYNEGTEEERKAYIDRSYTFYAGIIRSLTSRPLFLCVIGDYLRGVFYDKHKEESQR
jgi:hypothetical protein